MIEEVAEVLNSDRREYDVFARYGDEFCVLLPAVDEENARAIAARFVDSLQPQDFRLPDARKVTVSVGGAQWKRGVRRALVRCTRAGRQGPPVGKRVGARSSSLRSRLGCR